MFDSSPSASKVIASFSSPFTTYSDMNPARLFSLISTHSFMRSKSVSDELEMFSQKYIDKVFIYRSHFIQGAMSKSLNLFDKPEEKSEEKLLITLIDSFTSVQELSVIFDSLTQDELRLLFSFLRDDIFFLCNLMDVENCEITKFLSAFNMSFSPFVII